VADFSGTQGENGWYYGYERQPSQAFTELPYFGANDSPYWGAPVWGLGSDPWASGFAAIEPGGQQSNGLYSSSADPYADWSDRRWVSTVSGPISIAGLFGCPGNPSLGDDGVVGEILIDGQLIWSQSSYHQQPSSYSATGFVNYGSDVDFILNPNYSDIADWTTWTAQISSTPEPSTLALLAAGAAGLLAYASRRRQGKKGAE
jgi:hypothetical protein